jgi:hypothetical protein
VIESAECPECQNLNWYSNGDMNDLTQPDLEALECWQCGHKFWLDGATDVRETLGESLNVEEASFIEKGAKKPAKGNRRPIRKSPAIRKLTAKENLLRALKSKDPTAIAHATVQYALESPETITAIRNSLRLVPFLIEHGPQLQALPARERRIRLNTAWREIAGADWNKTTEKIVVNAALKALSGRPRK